jgi:hypothetical protein
MPLETSFIDTSYELNSSALLLEQMTNPTALQALRRDLISPAIKLDPQATSSALVSPALINFDEHEDEDISLSMSSQKSAPPAPRDQHQSTSVLTDGDQTPRNRTMVRRLVDPTGQNLVVEYDEESLSQSHSVITSVDDISLAKISTNQYDFLDDI